MKAKAISTHTELASPKSAWLFAIACVGCSRATLRAWGADRVELSGTCPGHVPDTSRTCFRTCMHWRMHAVGRACSPMHRGDTRGSHARARDGRRRRRCALLAAAPSGRCSRGVDPRPPGGVLAPWQTELYPHLNLAGKNQRFFGISPHVPPGLSAACWLFFPLVLGGFCVGAPFPPVWCAP